MIGCFPVATLWLSPVTTKPAQFIQHCKGYVLLTTSNPSLIQLRTLKRGAPGGAHMDSQTGTGITPVKQEVSTNSRLRLCQSIADPRLPPFSVILRIHSPNGSDMRITFVIRCKLPLLIVNESNTTMPKQLRREKRQSTFLFTVSPALLSLPWRWISWGRMAQPGTMLCHLQGWAGCGTCDDVDVKRDLFMWMFQATKV